MKLEPHNESDESLMVLYQQGEFAAFTELYSRFAPRIYGFVHSKVSNTEECSDLTQQVFLKIHKNRDHYNEKFPVVAWFFTIARNVLIDHFRKKKTVSLTPEMELSLQESPSQTESESPLLEEARKAIANLPEEQRDLLNQRFQKGLSFEEISVNLGIAPQTLRKRTSRLIASLKRSIR